MAHENPSERGKRHLREAGYTDHEKKKRAKKRRSGGCVHGDMPEQRPDRRARGGAFKRDVGGQLPIAGQPPGVMPGAGQRPMMHPHGMMPGGARPPMMGGGAGGAPMAAAGQLPPSPMGGMERGGRLEAFDWPDDAQGNRNARSALARGGEHKKGGKTVINVNQGDPQREQQAHQQGMQQGMQMGARAAAQKLAGGAGPPGGGAPPPGGGGPPMGRPPMMPPGAGGPPGMPPGMGGGMPPPGAMPPRPPQAGPPMPGPGGGPPMPMRRAGGALRRDGAGRFAGGAI